jgi:beta-lactamase regulating signal transducer with metallopeptidase domain
MAAARTMVLAAGAGLLLTLLRVKSASMRLFTWTAVIYAGLALPVLAWLLPPIPIRVPFSPSPAAVTTLARVSEARRMGSARQHMNRSKLDTAPEAAAPDQALPSTHAQTQAARASFWISSVASISWTSFATLLYLGVALLLFLRLLVGVAFARRLVRSSKPIQAWRITLRLSSCAHAWGRRVVPPAHESALVSVPVTIGFIAPTILLPIDWQEWDDAKLDAVISHEMSHVARRDGVSQCLSLLHRALFWFSPLAWWLNRQIAELAEEVSDEAALSSGAERNRYAATLLEFFEAVHGAQRRIHWQGVPIANAGQAEKRLRKILTWRGGNPMRWTRPTLVVVVAFTSFALYLAAAARPIHKDELSADTKSAQEQVPPAPEAGSTAPPSAPASPSSPPPPANGGVSNPGPAPALPSAPVAPATPPAPPSPVSPESDLYAYGYNDDEQRFVIVSGKTKKFTMSGSSEDARHVERLRNRISGDFIWFQRDEKSYIIRDQATVDRARQLWAPQEELGTKQEELGKQQEALGKQQEELGAQMEGVRVKLPDMSRELDQLRSELQRLGPDATVEQIGRIQAEIGELQSKIGEVQAHAGDRQGELGEKMAALGEQQGRLGEQQGELGRRQAELAQKAERAMKELLDDAIKKGIAQPEKNETNGASL